MITLASLEQATEQQVFDHIATHLLKQKERSVSDETCAYRGLNSLMCAAGCLISDDEYKTVMERNPWERLVRDELVPHYHQRLIQAFQDLHDNESPEIWPFSIIETAIDYNLEISDDVQLLIDSYC